jgi:hypothetical protein
LDDALFKDINRVDVFLQSAKYSAGLQKVTTRSVLLSTFADLSQDDSKVL